MFKRCKKFLFIFWGSFLAFLLLTVVFFYLISAGKLGFMPTFEELENPNNRFASEVYFEDGPMMNRYFIGSENRRYTEYREIPQSVVDALVATEDVRFYDHSGIDAIGLMRVFKGLLSGSTSSSGGGSTISQQLAKMLFPREPNRNSLEFVVRKFREWVIAVRLERSYTKEEIITMYLNKFDFLNLAVGINSAAEIYFQSGLDSLRMEQAAMLIGMAKNPALFNPVRRPEETLSRRNVVLSQMAKYGKISLAQRDSLQRLPLALKFRREDHKEGLATYFREHLRIYMTAKKPERKNYSRWAQEQFRMDSIAWASDPLYGWCNKNTNFAGKKYDIYSDGLKIYTTLNSRMQKYAEEAVVDHLSKYLQPLFYNEKSDKRNPPFSNDISNEEVEAIMNRAIRRTDRYRAMNAEGKSFGEIRKEFMKPVKMKIFTWQGVRDTILTPMDSLKHYKAFFRAGFMVMDPKDGDVKAYVGGPNFNYFMYDMVSLGKRQVGSTIKPILYTLAMQEGFSPCDKVPNIPQTFVLPDGSTWTAREGNKRAGEMVTLRWGLANSNNNISGWVLKQFTPQAVVQMAHKMGISSFIDPVPAVFLGTSEISVKEMVAAYSIFANKGVYNSPLVVSRIEDKYGNLIAEFRPRSKEVITAKTAYLMTNLLEGVVQEGTGRRLIVRYGLRNPMGGKTGTTQEHADGWFMGITDELVGGVWVGAEDRSIHFQTLAHGQGANMALPIWGLFMQKVVNDPQLKFKGTPFERPPGMEINLNCSEDEQQIRERIRKYGTEEEEEFF
ncbi:MAG: penicillin-binding protein [Culturomica sp.]|jgi:penicillin-binding protein 1A|nr:penicillin-binding protein [Culturomica sp.]